MGELGSIWLYPEDSAEDLKRKLQSTRMELEQARLEVSVAKEQTREKERQFHNQFQSACRERDGAREQLYNLLLHNNLRCPTPPLLMNIPGSNNKNNSLPISDDSDILLKQQHFQFLRANSSITESNTLSDSLFNNSYISSSPVDSMFHAAASPEFSTLNHTGGESGDKSNDGLVNNHQTFFHDMMSHANRYDHATAVIDGLVKGKVLPRKGKLLEAVREAGPLLQTLMLAGPLPSWRNPPPIQPFTIPQVTPFAEMSCSSNSHMASNISILNLSNGDVRWISPAMNMNNQIVVGKRQRLM